MWMKYKFYSIKLARACFIVNNYKWNGWRNEKPFKKIIRSIQCIVMYRNVNPTETQIATKLRFQPLEIDQLISWFPLNVSLAAVRQSYVCKENRFKSNTSPWTATTTVFASYRTVRNIVRTICFLCLLLNLFMFSLSWKLELSNMFTNYSNESMK